MQTMKTRTILFQIVPIAAMAIFSVFLVSCTTHDSVTPQEQVSNPITKDTLGVPNKIVSGSLVPSFTYVKGTLLSGKTYYMNGDIYVKKDDSLIVQPGVNLVVLGKLPSDPGNPSDQISYAIHISGTLLCQGTKDSQINIGPPSDAILNGGNSWPNAGWWGGIQCDSLAKVIT